MLCAPRHLIRIVRAVTFTIRTGLYYLIVQNMLLAGRNITLDYSNQHENTAEAELSTCTAILRRIPLAPDGRY